MNMPADFLNHGIVATRTVVIHDPDLKLCYQVAVPAESDEDAWQFLLDVGSGGLTGTGVQSTYLGLALPRIRKAYYAALEVAEQEITSRRIALGKRLNNAAELRVFTEWASKKRTAIARLWRIPAGPGGIIGGELRDWRQYGVGGRTFNNLLKRAEGKGLTGEAALLKILGSVDKPSGAATEAILTGARSLRGAGAVLFVGGAALTTYNVLSAPEEKRWDVARNEGISMAGGIVGGNLVTGVCFLLGMSGWGLVAVGLVGGIAGSFSTERLFVSHEKSPVVQQMLSGQMVYMSGF